MTLVKQQRDEDRADRLVERKHKGYRAYLRWVASLASEQAMVERKPVDKIESVREGQVVLADLLLVGSPEVKAAVRRIREAIGQAQSASMVELAKLIQDLKAGKLDHLKDADIEFFANVWFPAHYWDNVWPRVEELAELMSQELGG